MKKIVLTLMIALMFCLIGAIPSVQAETVRVMAANTTTGNDSSYDRGEGIRIFKGLQPDIVLIQEWNYGNNSEKTIDKFVEDTFGPKFTYFRESGRERIPNGVISRFPILDQGEWSDEQINDRDHAWAKIDVPGPTDLWAVSVHWSTKKRKRLKQATKLVEYVQDNVPEEDYLIIGGDFNTSRRPTTELTELIPLVDTAPPYSVDTEENPNTNFPRKKPYDAIYVNSALEALETPVVIEDNTLNHGLVFDSRNFSPLSAVTPVRKGDSNGPRMQHMAVIRDFDF